MGGPSPDGSWQSDRAPWRQAWLAAVVMLGVSAVVAGFALLGAAVGQPFKFFSKEPAETLDVSRYIGWQAHTTVLITATGAAGALFAGLAVRRMRGPRDASAFLLAAGGFTVLLILDDFLQFHESVYPRLFSASEQLVYPAYALLLAAIVWRWGRHVVRHDRVLALLAGAWLAVSVLVDMLVDASWIQFHVLEDGAKMMGLTLWTVFLVRTGLRLVLASTVATPTRTAGIRNPAVRLAGRVQG